MSDFILTDPEIRALGSLVEKEITTPEYYPLSLNALMTACNQKTNRDPVVSYDDCTVLQAVEDLKQKELIIVTTTARVLKYDNYFADTFHLSPAEVAVMCVLMLRGQQTAGEIRTRTERLYDFTDIDEVEQTLDKLAVREEGALVTKLPRQPGHKENRFVHLLKGDVEIDSSETVDTNTGSCSLLRRIEQLEKGYTELKNENEELRRALQEFKKQFE